jgi:hypothetical protein
MKVLFDFAGFSRPCDPKSAAKLCVLSFEMAGKGGYTGGSMGLVGHVGSVSWSLMLESDAIRM